MNDTLNKMKGYAGDVLRKLKTANSEKASGVDPDDLQKLEEAKELFKAFDRDHIWAFMSGPDSQDFRGNPKYLFVYINRYRSDIAAYWLCSDEDTIAQVRALGFTAYKLESPAAQSVIDRTGVLVTEQVKSNIPEGFENVKYLNLWHGVGFKHIERKQLYSDLSIDLAKKYIQHDAFYRDHQLLVVTSPTFEKEYIEDIGVDEDKLIRTGYLRCLYQKNFDPVSTFDHDFRKRKNLPDSTKLVVYAPTFRPQMGETFVQALPDFEALYQCCERNDLLLIFKVHPNMEQEIGFLRARETYGDRQRFLFWDNRDDFYEVMDQIDLAIFDYSSIFSDFVAAGVPHYIRYIFDADSYLTNEVTIGGADSYFDQTIGKCCYGFNELLDAIDNYKAVDDSAEFQMINEKLWAYTGGKDDFDKTIQQVLDFKVEPRDFPTLYSFDIFDTLISRKVLDPMGIFALVKDRMEEEGGFPKSLIQNFPYIRHSAELNVREFYRKSTDARQSERVEISFRDIYERIADIYNLSEEQTDLLSQWEMEAELDNVIPLPEQINLVKKLLNNGEKVILISDMYLPKDFVRELLRKADPVLADLPMYLSSDYGVLKTSQKLFFEVYKSFEPFYDFKRWVHYGDDPDVDVAPARKLKITVRLVEKPQFNDIQKKMVQSLDSGDAYLVGAMQARMCAETSFKKDTFVISYISMTMVPYVDWTLRDALRRGYRTLYFISRDGYHLKRIADEIIRVRDLDLKTKYIYASRRTWRIPSFIDEVDVGFWLSYGNFSDVTSKDKLLKAMDLDEATFRRLFPEIDPNAIDFNDRKTFGRIREIFHDSKAYNDYLLEKAAEERPLVEDYLRQELDFDEPFAFVEYYGRGYSQDCLVNLLEDIRGEKLNVPFYYERTVLFTMGDSIRYHFTTNATTPYFMESIFANMPYKSIEEYSRQEDGTIVPVITPIEYDTELYDSMNRILPEFAARYAGLNLSNPEDTDRMLHEFTYDYFQKNLDNPSFAENIGTLKDSVSLYGDKREFAPPYTEKNLEQFANKEVKRDNLRVTTNVPMSVSRSSEDVREKYCELYQILPGDALDDGRVLTESELKTNRRFRQKYEDLLKEAEIYKKEYDSAVLSSQVKNKAVLVISGNNFGSSGLDLVERALKEQGKIETVTVSIARQKYSPDKIAAELATAKYVIVSSPIEQFCEIQFRPETKEILLYHVAFSLYRQGLSTEYFLKWHMKYDHLAAQNDIAVLQVPSALCEKRYRRDFSGNAQTDCSLRGCCNTDVFFSENAAEEAKKQLIGLFPEVAEKKILLYMPTVLRRKSCSEWLSMLNMEVLKELIGEEYVVVVNFNLSQLKERYYNTIEIPGFSKMLNKGISIRQLMLAADVIVGDYRDTFYESALLHKPVYFTVNDCGEILNGKNFAMANEFDSCVFGPVVATPQDLAQQLQQREAYDYSDMERFRKEMLADCDGHSVERVVKYLNGNLD